MTDGWCPSPKWPAEFRYRPSRLDVMGQEETRDNLTGVIIGLVPMTHFSACSEPVGQAGNLRRFLCHRQRSECAARWVLGTSPRMTN